MQKNDLFFGLLVFLLLALCIYLLSCNFRGKRIGYIPVETKLNRSDSVALFRFEKDGKFRGMHIHSDKNLTTADLLPLVRNNVEWIVHTPFLVQENARSTEIEVYDYRDIKGVDRTNYEKDLLKSTNACNIKCVVKPLVWLKNPAAGEWRGALRFKKNSEWESWSEQYRAIILKQAEVCEEMKVEAFCIGTELTSIVQRHPDFLEQLAKDIRQIYSGKLLYAANWDQEFEQVPFWAELDYIGISAYFPLSKRPFPEVRHIKRGWKKHLSKIEKISRQFNKQVVFTEVGYRSTSLAADRPWEWAKDSHQLGERPSPTTQANCYKALFESCWEKDWFAGVLLWDWKIGETLAEDRIEINFNPKEKPAEAVFARWFGSEGDGSGK